MRNRPHRSVSHKGQVIDIRGRMAFMGVKMEVRIYKNLKKSVTFLVFMDCIYRGHRFRCKIGDYNVY